MFFCLGLFTISLSAFTEVDFSCRIDRDINQYTRFCWSLDGCWTAGKDKKGAALVKLQKDGRLVFEMKGLEMGCTYKKWESRGTRFYDCIDNQFGKGTVGDKMKLSLEIPESGKASFTAKSAIVTIYRDEKCYK